MKNFLNTRSCLRSSEIEAYLNHSLSDDEQFEVENHLLDCALCEAAVAGFAHGNADKMKAHLSEIESALPNIAQASSKPSSPAPSANLKPLRPWRNWVAAAAAIGFLLLSGLLYRQYGPMDTAALYAQSYESYETPFAGTRSSADDTDELSKGLQDFQNGAFESAILRFNSAIAVGDESSLARFHAGLAYMEQSQWPEAQDLLAQTRINSTMLYAPATWYLSLTYLKNDELQRCRDLLAQIKSDDAEYFRKAQSLLKRLPEAAE